MAFAGGKRLVLAEYPGSPTGVPADFAQTDALARAKYLTEAADCEACHTADGGKPFAGGLAFQTEFGTIYSPNITPDPKTGIGTWTDADFLKAVHRGISKDKGWLYPAFPYAAYTYLTDADALAIKAYLFSLPPQSNVPPPTKLRFPYNQRWLMAIWSRLFDPNARFQPSRTVRSPGTAGPIWSKRSDIAATAIRRARRCSPSTTATSLPAACPKAGGRTTLRATLIRGSVAGAGRTSRGI